MYKKSLSPSSSGPASNPLLYGIAQGLEQLFPPVEGPGPQVTDAESHDDGRDKRHADERD